MPESSDALSVRTRKAIFGGFGIAFTAGALLRLSYGDVLFPLVFGLFAAVAFTLMWLTGKWWVEMWGD